MKWSRSNKMKESFNCITHPHSTSCGELSSSSAGMDIVMNRWRTMVLQMMMCWMDHVGFYQFFAPCSTQLQTQPSSNTDLTHKHTSHTFHTSNKPAYQKTINVPLSSAILHKLRVQMSATHPKTKPSTDTDSCYPLSVALQKQGRFWNATSWLFGGANLFYLM